jgi:cell division protein FtsX
MEPSDIVVQLRRDGIVVHHATAVPALDDRQPSIVVFLEGTLRQHARARACAEQIPGVASVEFSKRSRSLMYVVLASPSDGAPP